MFIWTVVKRVVGIGFIIVGLYFWGMNGLLVGVVLNFWFSYFVNISLVSKHIGYKWTQQIKDLLPVAIASSLIALFCGFLGHFVHLDMYLDGVLKLIVYVALYVGWSLVAKPEAFQYFVTLIPSFASKFNRK